jgi:hypothetical protein
VVRRGRVLPPFGGHGVYMNGKATILAGGMVVLTGLFAACTLLKPSHEELSGGGPDETETGIGADADAADAQADHDAGSDATGDVDAATDGGDARTDADARLDADADAREEPAAACEGGKVCADACVPPGDPTTGCGLSTCTPCALAHADAGCADGGCRIAACNPGWNDCDKLPANGCESDPRADPANCGSCAHACTAPAHMSSECVGSSCADAGCVAGYTDCDNNTVSNGCEINTAQDPSNCSACGHICPTLPHSTAKCNNSQCGFSCSSGYADCDNDVDGGCESLLASDPANCGACGRACTLPHATSSCVASSCQMVACVGLWGNCDGTTTNGCEQDLSSDKRNCGTCGHNCVANTNCSDGGCH